jgi:hypothetical protein
MLRESSTALATRARRPRAIQLRHTTRSAAHVGTRHGLLHVPRFAVCGDAVTVLGDQSRKRPQR